MKNANKKRCILTGARVTAWKTKVTALHIIRNKNIAVSVAVARIPRLFDKNILTKNDIRR